MLIELEELKHKTNNSKYYGTKALRDILDMAVDCEDKSRPKGEWIYGEHDVAMCDGYRCDKCGFFVPWDYEHKFIDFINDYHFCPNCGAKMEVQI